MGKKAMLSVVVITQKAGFQKEVDQVYESATAIHGLYCVQSTEPVQSPELFISTTVIKINHCAVCGSSRSSSLIAERPTALELFAFRIVAVQKKMRCTCQK